MASTKTKPPKWQPLLSQRQLWYSVGNFDQQINGSTSWTFAVLADSGEDADRRAVARALQYGLRFTPELRSYARSPRLKRGAASYNRISLV